MIKTETGISLIFQDRNGVGRVPLLLPVQWENDWPVLGDNGKVPLKGEVPLPLFKAKIIWWKAMSSLIKQ